MLDEGNDRAAAERDVDSLAAPAPLPRPAATLRVADGDDASTLSVDFDLGSDDRSRTGCSTTTHRDGALRDAISTDLLNDPERAWSRFEPTADDPWDLPEVAHLHRRAGFAAPWGVLQRDLDDGPDASVDRLLERRGRGRCDGTPAAAVRPPDGRDGPRPRRCGRGDRASRRPGSTG